MKTSKPRLHVTQVFFIFLVTFLILNTAQGFAAQQTQSDSTGVEGTIPGDPPSSAATISLPRNGQNFSSLPITASGICQKGLLVEIFDNNVFVGSTLCRSGSYSIQIDLFNGKNDLIARVYDSLNQTGPDSSTTTVFFNSILAPTVSRPSLTTAYARRGADPDSLLSWPIALSGGSGPYALSIDWGDQTPLDLVSRQNSGTFNIEHAYSHSGVYNITVKATDVNGAATFLQLVGVANGQIQQSSSVGKNTGSGRSATTQKSVLWWPLVLSLVVSFVAFWLGKRHQLETIRSRLRRGERPI
jgi:hypothetical protein